VEKKISQYEKDIADMDIKFANPEQSGINLNDKTFFNSYESAKKHLAEMMGEWEKLSFELEELQEKRKLGN